MIPSRGLSAKSPLITISSDLEPFILISFRTKNSLEIFIVQVSEALDRPSQDVSSKKAKADILA